MKIITNNKKRDLLYGYELPKKIHEKIRYDYKDFENSLFFLYKNECYNLSEFERTNNMSELKSWHGYINDTYFSGICIKIDSDDCMVTVGRFCS